MTPKDKELINFIVKNPKVGTLLLKLYDLTEKTGVVIVSLATLSTLVESKVSSGVMKQIADSGMLNITFVSSSVVLVQKKDAKWKMYDKYAEASLANVTVLTDSIDLSVKEQEAEKIPEENTQTESNDDAEDAELERLLEEEKQQKKKN